MAHWCEADFLRERKLQQALDDLTAITDSLRLGLDYQARKLADTLEALTLS